MPTLELRIQATGRDVDELMHLLRLELLGALRDLPATRQRVEESVDGKVVQWVTTSAPPSKS